MPNKDRINSYKDLNIWKRTRAYVVLTYRITETFPSSERYGLTNQMRRAAVSMPSNIAEGFARSSKKEKIQFLKIAYASGAELETQLDISFGLGYLSQEKFKEMTLELCEIMKMVNGATKAVARR